VRRRKKLIAAKPVRVEKPVVKSQRAISDQTRYYMEQVIKMRANDVPYSEIAEILGITHEMARRIHDQACRYIPSLRVNEYREKLTEDLDWAKSEIKRIAQTFIPRVTVTGGVVRAPVLDENGNEDEEEKVLRDHDMWLKSLKEFSNIVSQQAKLHGVNLPVSNFNANEVIGFQFCRRPAYRAITEFERGIARLWFEHPATASKLQPHFQAVY